LKRYRVAQVGVGARGGRHIEGFLRNPDRFELVALSAKTRDNIDLVAKEYGIANTYTDAEQMLKEMQPDVMCFVTPPSVRLEMVELAAKYGVKGLAFEKPMATSLREAKTITDLCVKNGIKAIVSHQQKYLPSMQKLKEFVWSGDIGDVVNMHATTWAWLSQLGTHFMDYSMWINHGAKAKWVVGHVHGKTKLSDSHPAPDYILGEACFTNGVRGYIECGYIAPSHTGRENFWLDNRLMVHGTHGYAWAETDGRWAAFTKSSKGELLSGIGDPWKVQEREGLQAPYLRDLADWLDDDSKVHPCNVEISYHGYEILEGLCLSALNQTRIDLPLDTAECDDTFERMRRILPDVPPLRE
jgi:predicted dehydrogenase